MATIDYPALHRSVDWPDDRVNNSTLMLMFWVCGTFLGVWITLVLAGSEVRTQWFQSVMDRLPVL